MFVKGGMPGSTTLRDCKALESIVRKQAAEGRPYAAICAAPAVALGSWGLLKGLKVRTNISSIYSCAEIYLYGLTAEIFLASYEFLMM